VEQTFAIMPYSNRSVQRPPALATCGSTVEVTINTLGNDSAICGCASTSNEGMRRTTEYKKQATQIS